MALPEVRAELARAEAELAEHQLALQSVPSTRDLLCREEELQREQEQTEERLASLFQSLAKLKVDRARVAETLAAVTAERDALRARNGRRQQFKSAAERDRWLRSQLEQLRREQETAHVQLQQAEEECTMAQQRLKDLQSVGGSRLDEEASLRRQVQAASEARRELWRVQAKLESAMNNLESESERCRQTLLGQEHASGKWGS